MIHIGCYLIKREIEFNKLLVCKYNINFCFIVEWQIVCIVYRKKLISQSLEK